MILSTDMHMSKDFSYNKYLLNNINNLKGELLSF